MNVTRATTGSVKPTGTRSIRHLIAIVLLAGAGLATSAAPAAAAPIPSSCAYGATGDNGAWASCNAGDGAFRAWVQCKRATWPHSYYTNNGPWVQPGTQDQSKVYCGSSAFMKDTRVSYGISYT